jgi:hypothetical protein
MQKQRLTLKEQRFIDAYVGSASGNGTKAVLQAGYTTNRGSAKTLATRLLTKAHIRVAVNERTYRATADSIASAEERDRMLTAIARNTTAEPSVRIRAIAELNRCTGRHSLRHFHSGELTLPSPSYSKVARVVEPSFTSTSWLSAFQKYVFVPSLVRLPFASMGAHTWGSAIQTTAPAVQFSSPAATASTIDSMVGESRRVCRAVVVRRRAGSLSWWYFKSESEQFRLVAPPHVDDNFANALG